MDLLTKEAVLNAKDIVTERVPVPEWGGDVLVRTMSAADRDVFEQIVVDQRGADIEKGQRIRNVRARLVSMTVVDEAGALMFSESDIEKLGEKSAKAMDRVFAVAQRLNAVSAADVEDLAKN